MPSDAVPQAEWVFLEWPYAPPVSPAPWLPLLATLAGCARCCWPPGTGCQTAASTATDPCPEWRPICPTSNPALCAANCSPPWGALVKRTHPVCPDDGGPEVGLRVLVVGGMHGDELSSVCWPCTGYSGQPDLIQRALAFHSGLNPMACWPNPPSA